MRVIRISKSKLILLLVLFIPLSVSVGPAHAEKRYVTDRLIITLREGQGKEYRRIRALKTGTPLEVLEEDGRYLMVRTEEGEVGWVAKQYISSKIPKPVIITGLKQETNRLKVRVEKFEKRQVQLVDQLKEAKRHHALKVEGFEKRAKNNKGEVIRMTMELKQTKAKYNTFMEKSKDKVELIRENDRLQKENVGQDKKIDHLQKENERLNNKEMLRWFLTGAGVFFIGLIAGKVTGKKRHY
jgi:SH3 domain protein